MKTIAMTGHRPERLGLPLDVRSNEWAPIRYWIHNTLKEFIDKYGEITVFTGMASGADIVMGYVATLMKQSGFPVKINCICPCTGYGRKDPVYTQIMERADEVINIHDAWVRGCDNDRDEYMAKNCDFMFAIFDGHQKGGVWSTLKKAYRYKKPVSFCPKENWPDAYKEGK